MPFSERGSFCLISQHEAAAVGSEAEAVVEGVNSSLSCDGTECKHSETGYRCQAKGEAAADNFIGCLTGIHNGYH